jgi:transmembrane sensor
MMSEEMHILLGRFFSGEATEAEKTAVREWRLASSENEIEFALLEKMWNNSGEPAAISFDTEAAWKKVDASITSNVRKGRIIKMPARRVLIGVAATVILLLGLWWIVGKNAGNNMERVVADIDVASVHLDDGSIIYLRKGAVLEFPDKFEKGRRKVSLKGEAFFEVTHDPSNPFVIDAETTEIKVIGTSFTVSTSKDSVELIVKTGRVNFTPSADTRKKMMVIAGERAVCAGTSISKEVNTDPNFNAWQTKKLVFQRTPLSHVVATLADYYRINITFKKEDAAQLSAADFTDTFNDQSLESVLDELQRITTYTIKKTGDNNYEISIK